MRVGSSLLVDMSLGRPSVIDQLRGQLAGGQVKSGRVLGEASPGRYQVLLGGLRLTFMPSRPLEIGARFTARMISGQLVLDFPEMAGGPGEAPSADSSRVMVRTLPDLLGELGLPADPKLAATLRGLLLAGVSLNAETLQLFQAHAAVQDPAQAPLLAFLIQRAIPVDASVLMAVESLFQERKNLSQSLPDLVARLRALVGKLPDQEAPSDLKALLARLEGAIARAGADSSPEVWKAAVEQAVAKSGLFREARLALLEGGFQPLEDLKSILLELKQWLGLSVKNLPESESGTEPLKQLTQAALDRIEQSQLGSVRAPWQNRQLWVIQAPFWMEDRMEFLQLWVEKEAGDEKPGSAGPLRADLYLDLSQLGPLRVAMTLQAGRIEGRIYSSDRSVVDLLEGEVRQWIEERNRPGEEGVHFSSFRVQLAERPEDLQPPVLIPASPDAGGWPCRVDVEA